MMMLKRPMKMPLFDTILSVLCVRYRNTAARVRSMGTTTQEEIKDGE